MTDREQIANALYESMRVLENSQTESLKMNREMMQTFAAGLTEIRITLRHLSAFRRFALFIVLVLGLTAIWSIVLVCMLVEVAGNCG